MHHQILTNTSAIFFIVSITVICVDKFGSGATPNVSRMDGAAAEAGGSSGDTRWRTGSPLLIKLYESKRRPVSLGDLIHTEMLGILLLKKKKVCSE